MFSGTHRVPAGVCRGTVSRMKRLVLAVALIVSVAPGVRADFAAGLKAYEAGDYYAAYKEWLPLAEADDPAAQRNLGHLYRLGRGVTKDFVKAAEWYRKSAEQGFARAQANLGNMYLRGQGVQKDPKTAASWFGRAAKQNHPIAQYNLGLMYENGIGVSKDDVAALGWFFRASKAGHRKAAQRLARLVSRGSGPPTDDALPPTESGRDRQVASAKGGNSAQPLHEETGPQPTDEEQVARPARATDTAESDAKKPQATVAPHPVIVAEAREDAARSSSSIGPTTQEPTAEEQSKDDSQSTMGDAEKAAEEGEATQEDTPAKPRPPHPVVLAEAVQSAEATEVDVPSGETAAIEVKSDTTEQLAKAVPPPAFLVREAEQETQTAAATPVTGRELTTDETHSAPESEETAHPTPVSDPEPIMLTETADSASAKGKETEIASLAPVSEASDQQEEEKAEPIRSTTLALPNVLQPQVAAEEQGSISPSATAVTPTNDTDAERAGKSDVRQRARKLATLRDAARRATHFDRRLQSQLPNWASEFSDAPTPDSNHMSVEISSAPPSVTLNATLALTVAELAESGPDEDVGAGRSSETAPGDAPTEWEREQTTAARQEPSQAPQPEMPVDEGGTAAGENSDNPTHVTTTARSEIPALGDASAESAREQTTAMREEPPQAPKPEMSVDEGGTAAEEDTDNPTHVTTTARSEIPAPGNASTESAREQTTAMREEPPQAPKPEMSVDEGGTAAEEDTDNPTNVITTARSEIPALGYTSTESAREQTTAMREEPPQAPQSEIPVDEGGTTAEENTDNPMNLAATARSEIPVAVTMAEKSATKDTTAGNETAPADLQSVTRDDEGGSVVDHAASPPINATAEAPETPKDVAADDSTRPEGSAAVGETSPSENRPVTEVAEVSDGDAVPLDDTDGAPDETAMTTPGSAQRVAALESEQENAYTSADAAVGEPVSHAASAAPEIADEPASDHNQPHETEADTGKEDQTAETAAPDPSGPSPNEPAAQENFEGAAPPMPAVGAASEAPPEPSKPVEIASVSDESIKQSLGEIQDEQRERDRERVAQERQRAREVQASRRLQKLLKIQAAWNLTTLQRGLHATPAETAENAPPPAHTPVEESVLESVPAVPAEVPPNEKVEPKTTTVVASAPKPLPAVPESAKQESSADVSLTTAPLSVALDASLSAYQNHDYETAFDHWLPRAEAGDANAQFFVGGLYRDGAGVPVDPVRAYRWWSLAAAQGHLKADRLLQNLKFEMLPEEIAAARQINE